MKKRSDLIGHYHGFYKDNQTNFINPKQEKMCKSSRQKIF